jgi:hypothetical protein
MLDSTAENPPPPQKQPNHSFHTLFYFITFECENSCGHFNEWEKLDYFLEVLSSVKIE